MIIVLEQSTIAIVIEDVGIIDGLRRGWDIVRSNLGPMVAMALFLIVGLGLVVGFVIGLPLVFISAPIFLGAFSGSQEVLWTGFVLAGICFCLYLPVIILFSGLLRAYISTAWTLTYLRLTTGQNLPEPVPATD